MKQTISCDCVFDVLTRTPFPSGSDLDDEVESHLVSCLDCRRLAEALKPALELFHEAVPADEVSNLPGYFGNLDSLSDPHLPPWNAKVHSCHTQNVPPSGAAIWRFVGGVACGALAGLLVWAVVVAAPFVTGQPQKQQALASVNRITISPDLNVDLLEVLHQLGAPSRCRDGALPVQLISSKTSLDSGANASHASHCCTYCHSAGNPKGAAVQFAKLAKTCQFCHRDGVIVDVLALPTSS